MTSPQPPTTLGARLKSIDDRLKDMDEAIRHSASRRSTVALGVALAALAALLIGSVAERSVSSHGDCVRGNETRAAIATIDRVRAEAFVVALLNVLTTGRPAEAQERARVLVEQLQDATERDPSLKAAQARLEPRDCSYWPF